MGQRLALQGILEEILGSRSVYFQPPANVQMQYPAIRYEWSDLETKYAGDLPYNRTRRYQITVIDRDPDSVIPDAIARLQMSSFDRAYQADNLNHFIISLYF